MEINDSVTALAALAQKSRLSIFRLLVQVGEEGMSAGDISGNIGIPPSSLSFHLKELLHAGLVTSSQNGRFIIYKANFERANRLVKFLSENCCGGHTCTFS